MKILPALPVLCLGISAIVMGEPEPAPKVERGIQVGRAYGYIHGQEIALKIMTKKFPDLAKEASVAQSAFDSSAFGPAKKALEDELMEMAGAEWPQAKKELADVDSEIEKSNENATHDEAVDYLAAVKSASKGDGIRPDIRATLLASNPKYDAKPELELTEGWKQTYRTKDQPEAKGLDFSVSLPESWLGMAGDQPGIIRSFQNHDGHGSVVCSLFVTTSAQPIAKEEKKALFSDAETMKGVVPEGQKFVSYQPVTLAGEPGGILISDTTEAREGLKVSLRCTQFVTVTGKTMVFIQFMAASEPGSKATLDETQAKFLPLFKLIAASLVVHPS